MNSVGPHDAASLDMALATQQAWERAMALTIGQLQPRPQPSEPADPLPVAEAQEMDWEDWCAEAELSAERSARAL